MLSKSLNEANTGLIEEFQFAHEFSAALFKIWTPQLVENHTAFDDISDYDIAFSRKPPEPTAWTIAFTQTFQKSIANVDKKLQGRILMAISELSEEPLALLGDTRKPLGGDLKGLWRHRVGDYRLIYEPNTINQKVVLLEFVARGSAYD